MGPVNGPKTKQGKPLSHKNLMSDTIVHQSDYQNFGVEFILNQAMSTSLSMYFFKIEPIMLLHIEMMNKIIKKAGKLQIFQSKSEGVAQRECSSVKMTDVLWTQFNDRIRPIYSLRSK